MNRFLFKQNIRNNLKPKKYNKAIFNNNFPQAIVIMKAQKQVRGADEIKSRSHIPVGE